MSIKGSWFVKSRQYYISESLHVLLWVTSTCRSNITTCNQITHLYKHVHLTLLNPRVSPIATRVKGQYKVTHVSRRINKHDRTKYLFRHNQWFDLEITFDLVSNDRERLFGYYPIFFMLLTSIFLFWQGYIISSYLLTSISCLTSCS